MPAEQRQTEQDLQELVAEYPEIAVIAVEDTIITILTCLKKLLIERTKAGDVEQSCMIVKTIAEVIKANSQ